MRRYQEGYVLSCLVFILLFFISNAYLSVYSSIDADAARALADPAYLQPKLYVEVPQPERQLNLVATSEPPATTRTVNAQTASVPVRSQPRITQPYNLTYTGVEQDLNQLGYSFSQLRQQSIEVMGHNRRIPKKCSSGQRATTSTSGLAIKTSYRYAACSNGEQPLYEAYKPANYECVVIYNRQSGVSLAILAHEIGHCLHFQHGQYRAFDLEYKKIRAMETLTMSQFNELVAEDYMVCHHQLDTNFGSSSYYSRYGISRPSISLCGQLNQLYNKHLLI